jgi:hypothetical protein
MTRIEAPMTLGDMSQCQRSALPMVCTRCGIRRADARPTRRERNGMAKGVEWLAAT